MNPRFEELIVQSKSNLTNYKPLFFRLSNSGDLDRLNALISSGEVLYIHDEITGQLSELVKMSHPSKKIHSADYGGLISEHLRGVGLADYGVWVFYPWNGRLVHILDEEEFARVRTNRNQYKITQAEQLLLSEKKIGIVGLSVGQSIALTLSMERGYGELRLTDFDTLELSNLNRIRAGVHNLGVPKAVITAREIAEIDPFLKVICFLEGLSDENMHEFFTAGGKLDLLVDECDSLDVKILARYKARDLRIPVIMDTSDRGMLDVERFDITPDRPILHGTINNVDPSNIKDLSTEDKIPIMLQMLGIENISLRAKASMLEVEQTINTWPQLASSVALGGAVGADVSRRILLDQFHQSGRYYIDLDQQIADPVTAQAAPAGRQNPFRALDKKEMHNLVSQSNLLPEPGQVIPPAEIIRELVNAASAAPSTGNDQPWKWLYQNGRLYLFHDQFRSHSFGDFKKTASFISLGAAFENLCLKAAQLGLEACNQLFPVSEQENLVAAIYFRTLPDSKLPANIKSLGDYIFKRHTNRLLGPKKMISEVTIQSLVNSAQSIAGVRIKVFTKDEDLRSLAAIIGACDKMRLMNPEGHFDFVHREMRWTSTEAERTKDGIDIRTLGLGHSLQAALNVIRDEEVIRTVGKFGGGKALGMLAVRTVSTASAICMISVPGFSLENFFNGGRAVERFWLEATRLGLAVHPLISPLYFFARYLHGGEGLDSKEIQDLQLLREQFQTVTGADDEDSEVFLVKIAVAPEPEIKSYRLPLEEILVIE